MQTSETGVDAANAGGREPASTERVVVLETPDGTPLARWLCTPDRLTHLALGWLTCEGLITKPAEVRRLEAVPPDRIRIELEEAARRRLGALRGSSAPGPAPPPSSLTVQPGPGRPGPELELLLSDPARLSSLFRQLFEADGTETSVGGVHTGALVLGGGIVDAVEDVSRSAVIDKLVGAALTEDGMPDQSLLLLSGRISATIAAKLARAGVSAAATISIPTTLAVEITTRAGVAMVGRARRESPFRYRIA